MMRNKRGMIDGLVVMGYSLIVLAILVGVGLVVLQNFANSIGAGAANTSISTLMGYIGSGNGGLIAWIPAIIALVIGIYFLSAFGFGKNKGGKKV